jgi:hypothetical protein
MATLEVLTSSNVISAFAAGGTGYLSYVAYMTETGSANPVVVALKQ